MNDNDPAKAPPPKPDDTAAEKSVGAGIADESAAYAEAVEDDEAAKPAD